MTNKEIRKQKQERAIRLLTTTTLLPYNLDKVGKLILDGTITKLLSVVLVKTLDGPKLYQTKFIKGV